MERYLDQELLDYTKKDYYPCHMPGHKRKPMGNWIPEDIDITEIDGFDNLHHPEDILREGQERLARVFGAEESFFLVNGSTCGLLAAICGSVKKGDTILVSRNCHKAVYHAIYLMELKAEYLYPMPTAYGIQGSIDPDEVAEALKIHPEVSCVVITSPTYDGVISDVERIAGAVHAAGIPLIVDEAHGAHFGFSEDFPQKAIRQGADLCIESVHKTLPAYTQSAVLHMAKSPFVRREQVKRYLGIFQTSSPSYILMAGIDRCVRILQQQGETLFGAFAERLDRFYENCRNLCRIEVECQAPDPGIFGRDRSKILISGQCLGLDGQHLYEILLERYHLQMEMASGHYVTAIMTIMDTDEGFLRLYHALEELDREAVSGTEPVIFTAEDIYAPTEKVLEISAAMDADKREVPLECAGGCVSGEFLYLYPPGIPILAPGERISAEILETVLTCRQRGMKPEGMEDLSGKTILVVAY